MPTERDESAEINVSLPTNYVASSLPTNYVAPNELIVINDNE